MQILLLGPVEMRAPDGSALHVGGARRRAVLATLAMDVNRVVSVQRLLDTVWDQAPPPSARTVLQGHVASLRGMFDDSVRLITREPGYVLQADPARIDVHHQRELLARADAAEDRTAVRLLRQALGCWRGPAFADCGSTALREGSAHRLESTRLRALEQLAERLLRIGHAELVTAELAEALEAHPLRESLVRLLMLCLHQEGRQAEALATYHALRARIAEEAGVDPGAEVQATFAQLLRPVDPPAGPATQPVRVRPPAVPQQPEQKRCRPSVHLPREPGGFMGRTRELAWLSEHCGTPDTGHGDGLLLVTGPAGVGKTALLLRWAHRFAADFDGGRLWADLQGCDETEPLAPGEALACLLRALGVPESAIPVGPEERAALYRSRLAGRRTLVVLDNAADAAQVRPLLPAVPGCVTVVTSRRRLIELVAQEGAAVLPLGVLSADEGFDVLARVAGRPRLDAEPAASRRVVELCEGLPLALRIAGARLATRPHWTVAGLAGELADECSRLATLSVQGQLSVEAALELSCRTLPEPAAHLFRLLGAYPGRHIDAHAAAAVAACDVRSVRSALGALDSAHLLQETAPGSYARHDLVRLYARQAAEELEPAVLEAAHERLLDYYLAATAAATALARPTTPAHRPARPGPGGVPPFADPAHALTWFRREEPAIRDLVVLSAGWGRVAHGCRLAESVGFLYYDDGGRLREWEQITGRALAAADAEGIGDDWPRLHSDHGAALHEQGRHAEAVRRHRHACRLADRAGEPVLRQLTRNRLANSLLAAGAPEQAAGELKSALAAARELDDGRLVAQALNNLAHAFLELGRPEPAMNHAEESLELLSGRSSDPFLVVATQTHAEALYGTGRVDEALSESRRALELGRTQGNLRVETYCADFVGKVLYAQGRRGEARDNWQRALDLSRQQGRPVEGLRARIAACSGS